MAHAGGRPLKYGSVEELQKKIDKYLESCWEEAWEQQWDRELGKHVWVQLFDKDDEPLMRLKETPTITGLAVFLDTSRETLMNYQNKDEFFDTIKRAKDLIEYYTEKDVSQGKMNTILGIFKLKNFGWKDEQIINMKPGDDDLSQMSDEELDKKLAEMGYKKS